jgi:hypothetical protein
MQVTAQRQQLSVGTESFRRIEPAIAFVNLSGTDCDSVLAEDSSEIGGLFHGKVVVATTVPACDVLFLYCAVDTSGNVVGQETSLRDVVGKSGAVVAVIASELKAELMLSVEFQKSLRRANNPPTNLIMTRNRNGASFIRFYKSFFQLLWTGMPFAQAWNEVVPHLPRLPDDIIPELICIIEAGEVTFGTGRPGESAAASSSPPIADKKTARSKRTFKQRMTAAGVGALIIALVKVVQWLNTPAPPPRVVIPSYSEIILPLSGSLPPGPPALGPVGPPNWGPIPSFQRAAPGRSDQPR